MPCTRCWRRTGAGGGMGRYVDVTAREGLAPGVFAAASDSARARQYREFLTADLVIGPHGADMHAVSYVKPSALVLEVGVELYDTVGRRAGYFSHLAYARNVGYLRIAGHTIYGGPANAAYLSLPEWRHGLSTAVCAWLAMNAARLENAGRGPHSHLVPWWCRGASLGVVEAVRRDIVTKALQRNVKVPPPPPDSATRRSGLDTARMFMARRSEARFGFSVPECSPLVPALSAAAVGGGVALDPRIGQAQLDRLQTECARPITGALRDNDGPGRAIRGMEALQSFAEVGLSMGRMEAATLARHAAPIGADKPGVGDRLSRLFGPSSAVQSGASGNATDASYVCGAGPRYSNPLIVADGALVQRLVAFTHEGAVKMSERSRGIAPASDTVGQFSHTDARLFCSKEGQTALRAMSRRRRRKRALSNTKQR